MFACGFIIIYSLDIDKQFSVNFNNKILLLQNLKDITMDKCEVQ